MARIGAAFTQHWGELHAALMAYLTASTSSFFRDVAEPDAQRIQDLISGGKHLRGCVALAVCDGLGGSIDSALPTAIAIECVHAASLVHDDVVDGDSIRRGRPALWTVDGSARAVLLGDVMFATALLRSAEIGAQEVLTLARALAMMSAGAYKEPFDAVEVAGNGASGTRSHSLYEHIIGLKTGALFAAAAELGAIAAQASPAVRAAASAFGGHVGEAFQLADDLQDVVSRAGSATLSPQENATLLMLHAHFDADPAMHRARRSTEPDQNIQPLTAVMEAEIARRIALARQALAPFPQEPGLQLLHALPETIVGPIHSLTPVMMAEPNNVR